MRIPSGNTLRDAAAGDWLNLAACRNQPAFTDQDPDVIAVTCSRCRAAADCAKLGKLELARALGDKSDSGDQRVYAGHQLRDLLLLARRDTAGRKAAYQALDTTLEAAIVEGFRCIGIEREADYLPLIDQRIARAHPPLDFGEASA